MLGLHAVGGLTTIVVASAAIMQLLSLVSEWWLDVGVPQGTNIKVGLLRTCIGPHCSLTNYTMLTACGRAEGDISSRFTIVVALLIAGAVFAVLALFIGASVFALLRSLFGRDGEAPPPDRVRGGSFTSKIAVVFGGTVFSGIFDIIGLIVLRDTTEDYANCGKPICKVFTTNSNRSCDYGFSYRFSIAGTILILVGALMSLIWVVLLARNVADASQEAAVLRQEEVASASRARAAAPADSEVPANAAASGAAPADDADEVEEDFAEVDEPNEPYDGAAYDSQPAYDQAYEDPYVAPAANAAAKSSGPVLPEGCWEAYEGTLHWSAELGFFYDTSSCCYYDPIHEIWYSPDRDEWFILEEDGRVEIVAPPHGGLHANEHHGLTSATPPVTTPTHAY